MSVCCGVDQFGLECCEMEMSLEKMQCHNIELLFESRLRTVKT